jgi:malate dehydrogenase (oxaloacetate-decarboxylating)
MNNDIYKNSLELHEKYGGKLETRSKVKLDSKEALSEAYSPGVAEISRVISKDKNLAYKYTLKKNTVAVVSDGSAILGLGNLGALSSIPVMEGKSAIMKEFADVDSFPICLDTQDTEEIIKAVHQIAPVFGGINLEDIASPKCFEIESRLRKELEIPVMHDDQWGAATVTLAGVINSLKLAGLSKESVKVVISGVGAAGVATGKLLISYGIRNIIFCDSKGVINKNREDLNKEKSELLDIATPHDISGSLEQAISDADIFIGLSKPQTLTKDMIRKMKSHPIIFALANPTPEIMPEDALEAGAYIIATGRSDYPNQVNNSLVFPGLWKGVLEARIPQFKMEMFVSVAEALANSVDDLNTGKILPTMFDKNLVETVSNAIKKYK